MNCFIAICSEEYLGHYRVLYDSIKKHSPHAKQILYFIGQNIPKEFDGVININSWGTNYVDKLTHICSLRARVVLDAFNRGYNKVVFTGAKLEFFSGFQMDRVFYLLDYNNAYATPHILEPLPDDTKLPSNAGVNFTGHLSTDLVAFRDTLEIRNFLEWQDEMMKTKCETTAQTYLDQSWLNFLPFFVDKVYIERHLGQNVAYWNYMQRGLQKKENSWKMRDNTPLVSFQYSGLDLNRPEGVSRHQNRYVATGDFLQFLKDYADKVKAYK